MKLNVNVQMRQVHINNLGVGVQGKNGHFLEWHILVEYITMYSYFEAGASRNLLVDLFQINEKLFPWS